MRNSYSSFGRINRGGESAWETERREKTEAQKEYDPFADKQFDVNKLEENEIHFHNQTYAKIPNMPGRVFSGENVPEDVTPEQELAWDDIAFFADRQPDEETGETHDQVVVIGKDLSGLLKGMMLVNFEYYNYFDSNGKLIYDPLRVRQELEAEKKAKAKAERKLKEAEERRKAGENAGTEEPEAESVTGRKTAKDESAEGASESTANRKTAKGKAAEDTGSESITGAKAAKESAKGDKSRDPEDRTLDEIKASILEKEKLLEQKLQAADEEIRKYKQKNREMDDILREAREAKEEIDVIKDAKKFAANDKLKQHLRFLDNILDSHAVTVKEMAKKKPGLLMSKRQIQTINEIMEEIREYFSTSSAAEYLHLAEEPQEEDLENHPGTTYGEMALLLSAYRYTMHAYECGHLYMKEDKENGFPDEEEGTET